MILSGIYTFASAWMKTVFGIKEKWLLIVTG
jgi:hypothetical protein